MRISLALAVISAATLAYEVLLVRLFAITQWHHFAFMAISIALLGFGASGTWLAIWQDWAKPRFTAVFASSAALFGIGAPLAFLLAQALPFNALAMVWEPSQLLYLPVMYLLLVVPFFCGATCIGLTFVCFGERIGRLYAFNLVGSAAGALGVVGALAILHPSDTLRLIAATGFVAAVLILLDRRLVLWPALTSAAVVLGVAAWAVVPDAWFALKVSAYKGLPQALEVSGARVLRERFGPLGLLTVVDSPTVPFRYVPGLSLNAPAPPPGQLGVFTDGGSMTAMTRFDGALEPLTYLDYTTDALAYHLAQQPSVLVLGTGGGRSVLQALYHGAQSIDAVELDPNMVRLLAQDFADETGDLSGRPEVQFHVAEARGFVTGSDRQWDVIQIPLLDAFGAAGTGVHGLSETYIYTVEALRRYLDRLKPDGWLSITRWLKLPPRDTLKLFATALDALQRMDVDAPERRLLLLRGLNTTTLLIKNAVLSETDIDRARTFAQARSFDLSYYPGIRRDEANHFNVLDQPYFFDGAMALIGDARDAFLARYKFDIAPATDERPYFFDFLKWRTLPELLAIRKAGGAGLLELGSLILVATLVQAAALGVVLILAPLWSRRRGLAGTRQLWRVGAYFLALGLGFLFVEIAFIQKFILFLSHPLYAVAVVLAGFLLFAGIGSGVSPWLATRVEAWRLSALELSVAMIVALSLLYLWLLPGLFQVLAHLPDIARIAVSLGLIGPLAFFMGMPFPLGLSRVWSAAPALVPWAWGMNGCASVLSAMLATLIAMHLGFSAVVLAAAIVYAAAAVVFHRPLRHGLG
ncbi:MAG: SAM-dependent methyltransferase [Alphaproteobacteria bacterium]|nr:SAM-dependent methyltransferase [Alphaproteobacteria bacterium]